MRRSGVRGKGSDKSRVIWAEEMAVETRLPLLDEGPMGKPVAHPGPPRLL
jgi:hypothetical protein